MSEYKGIKGFQVTTRTEDPTPFAQAIENNPYSGSWSSGGNTNSTRTRAGAATKATLTAGLVFGTGSATPFGKTEEYDGTSWSEQNDLNNPRYISYGGGGTQTSALTTGGYDPPASPNAAAYTELYDGTSWTCLLYTSPSPRDVEESRMPSSA